MRLLLLLVAVAISETSAAVVNISETSRVHWMAPSEKHWSGHGNKLPTHVKDYWKMEWSKSTYEPDCSDDQLKIVPVYFWPGDRVDLPCSMCEMAFVLNGKMKNWARADDIADFLEDPAKFVLHEKSMFHLVENEEWLENSSQPIPPDLPEDYLPSSAGHYMREGKNINKDPPVYVQRDGKLTILRSSTSSQGVYFCSDADSQGSIYLFYVLMAMVPPVCIYPENEAILDDCGHKDTIHPHSNWRFHFVPFVRKEPPANCHLVPSHPLCGTTDGTAHVAGDSSADDLGISKAEPTEQKTDCTFEFCRSEIQWGKTVGDEQEMNMAIELRWSPWTSCEDGITTQRREAHCYLVRKAGKQLPQDTVESLEWLEKLNQVFEQEPFNSQGIRLYSSLIPSLIYKKPKIVGCERQGREAENFDLAFRRYFLRAMDVSAGDGEHMKKKTDRTFRLETPFQACLGYERYKDIWEVLIGTYAVETRECPV